MRLKINKCFPYLLCHLKNYLGFNTCHMGTPNRTTNSSPNNNTNFAFKLPPPLLPSIIALSIYSIHLSANNSSPKRPILCGGKKLGKFT